MQLRLQIGSIVMRHVTIFMSSNYTINADIIQPESNSISGRAVTKNEKNFQLFKSNHIFSNLLTENVYEQTYQETHI